MAQVAITRFQQLPHQSQHSRLQKMMFGSSIFTRVAGFVPASTTCPSSWEDSRVIEQLSQQRLHHLHWETEREPLAPSSTL